MARRTAKQVDGREVVLAHPYDGHAAGERIKVDAATAKRLDRAGYAVRDEKTSTSTEDDGSSSTSSTD